MSHSVQRNVPVPATLPDVQAFMNSLLASRAAPAVDLDGVLLDPRSFERVRIRIPRLDGDQSD
jgi:hypothetical protein